MCNGGGHRGSTHLTNDRHNKYHRLKFEIQEKGLTETDYGWESILLHKIEDPMLSVPTKTLYCETKDILNM